MSDVTSGRIQNITISAMKPILYRIETYIVPEVENLSVINKIDNLKIAKQFDIKSESISGNNAQNEEDASIASYKCEELTRFSERFLVKDITDENETQLDEYYDNDIVKHYNNNSFYSEERLNVQKAEFQASIGPQEVFYPAKQFSRVNSLTSIDERSENSLDTKLSDFCRHGYKNGCTASIPSPEEVSEEIFRENWLQKIEVLRDRETILREKEVNLQKRERELFRKEKELRIMERILNDKMKQVDLQLKYQKSTPVGKRLEEAARILSSDVEKSDNSSEEKIPKKDIVKKEDISKQEEVSKKDEISRKIEIPKKAEISKRAEIPKKTDIPKKVEAPKDAQSIINPCEKEESNKKVIHPVRSNSSSRKSSFSRTHSYASLRYKERSKVNYDDLNSTLSAASIDSPSMRTSEWFNPALYKKPHVFTRSASERWPKHKKITTGKLQKIEEKLEHVIEEDKIFRKVSDNICALQEKETRFQDYGLVDCIPGDKSSKAERNSDNEEKLSSYLDIEIGEKHSHRSLASVAKDRPVSWTSETNEWLQKKRQMYDSTSKQSAENKENRCNKRNVAETVCAKNTRSKRFFLFR